MSSDNATWPRDEDGNPMVLIRGGAYEKVGLPNYSAVDIGPISVERFVRDGDSDHIKQQVIQTQKLVEEIVAGERELVLKSLQQNAK